MRVLLFASIAACLAALSLCKAALADYKTSLTKIRYANAYCESGGDPYNRRNSKYRGKWQFDQTTWNYFAPSWLDWKDPATVAERWQDYVALRVTYDAWPNC